MSNSLGKVSSAHQISIGEKINNDKINEIFYSFIDVFDEYLKLNNDLYANEILENLKKNKKLCFPLNKHMELFIYKHLDNPEKLIRYIIFRFKFYIAGTRKINLGYPPYILIETVSTCNLRCPFCFQTDKTFTKKPFMGIINFDLFTDVLDQADKLGVGAITIGSRGEPTMHKKFNEMLDYTSEKNNILEVKLNTNGSYLTEKICHSIFRNNLTQVVISSDHYIKKNYEKLRVGSNFEKIVSNVDMLFSIRKEHYPNSITEIRISGVDNERNLDRKKFKEFWIKRCDHVSATYPLERWNTYKNSPHPEIKDPCENLWDRMYVWFDGKVNPCDADYKSFLSYGDANKFDLKDLWNNKVIEKNRKLHLAEKRGQINPCDRCGASYI
jgi:MoaA/NifB/PqqE/SkfB family radical SAM enzyme